MKSIEPKIEIIFTTGFQKYTKIIIDPNKSVNDLIKFYFEKIKLPNLIGDPSITFAKNGELLDSKNLIKTYIKKSYLNFMIFVYDMKEKLQHGLNY